MSTGHSVADPHCHTTFSDGMVSPSELVAAAASQGIAVIAVTDHDTMGGVEQAQARGAELGVGVVPGQEITTAWPAQTHVVGWFLAEPIKSGMSLADTVDAIQDQGGLAVIPHPFMPTYFGSCQPGMLERLLERREVDAIEAWHTAFMTGARRKTLESFISAHEQAVGALVAGSDSHFGIRDLGRCVTRFPGESAEDFRRAVVERTTGPERRQDSRRVPLGLLLRQQRKSLVELPLRRLFGRLG